MPHGMDTSRYSYGRDLCKTLRENTGADVFTVCSTKFLNVSRYADDHTVPDHHFNFTETSQSIFRSRMMNDMRYFSDKYQADDAENVKYSLNNAMWSFHHVKRMKDSVLYQVSLCF